MRAFIQQPCDQGYENEVIEFKAAKNSYDCDKLGKYFSALSNEANLQGQAKAWLLFGVHDQDKTIIGSQFCPDRASLMSLKEEIAKQTTGNLTFSQIQVETIDGKRVVLFEIPAAPKGIPIAWKGHFYGRNYDELSTSAARCFWGSMPFFTKSARSAIYCKHSAERVKLDI